MTWLTWRQFRAQFFATVGLLVILTAYLIYLGTSMRSAYTSDIVGCLAANGCQLDDAKDRFIQDYRSLVTIPAIILIAVPAIIGVFWGTPLITRELETNTHRLVWNQSITRTHWLAVKLAVVGLTAIVTTAALSLLLTWAASRYDQTLGNRFDPLSFATRNVAPLGYITFAFVLGLTVGLLIRRTVPAMAATLLIVGVVQLLLPTITRPYLRPPATITVAYNQETRFNGGQLSVSPAEPLMITGYSIPGSLTLTERTPLLTSGGKQVSATDVQDCTNAPGQSEVTAASWDALEQCIGGKNLHFEIEAQTPDRYWPFQWTEFGAFLIMGFVLTGVAFWRIRQL
ncbi:ABC transporter permease subunit [Phytohabitans houttuyneae]|uniref:Transporter n=1 Tax=Phytohabitans houttuyneae TaxID=1076126 RepID=A0A6V8K6V6_9ACTN|nr:ABC transporter permease subunit [Phytohabitans houttuyneae]GFJ77849.1 transporter [Phytohabitans houttuyneae]